MKKIMNKCQLVISVGVILASVNAMSLNHQNLMWGLKNTGASVKTYINPMQSYQLQAIAGEDIRMAPRAVGRKIKVAVLDTGFDYNHPDLQNLIFKNQGKCAALEKHKACLLQAKDANSQVCRDENLIASENIYPADCLGWSILDESIKNTPNNIIGRPDFSDNSGHGTHVAGIISAVSNNIEIIPVQVVGNGPNQPIKPFSIDLSPNENKRNGFSTAYLSERVSRGIIYAMNAGAEVINLSLGWPADQTIDVIKEAISEAQKRGIIIVAAAGNDATSEILRPCQYAGVICVAAHSPDGALSSFSNYGFGVDIAAPGSEILSTIPTNIRSVRLPGYVGYDYLSGTSQATPFVTGVVAEMLSRGVSKGDIYARLILGARPLKNELPVLVGPAGGRIQAIDGASKNSKNILSGALDMMASLNVQPQALILPANKEVEVINWNRKSLDLGFVMSLKNYWKEISGKKIQVSLKPTHNSELEPLIISVTAQQNLNQWKQSEEKTFNVKLKIKDQADASLSRLPSELSYQASVYIDGVLHRSFEVKAEVIVNISEAITGSDVFAYNIKGEIPRDMKLTLVDEVFDAQTSRRDYFMVGKSEQDEKSFNIALARNDNSNYVIENIQSIKFDGDLSKTRPQYKIRIDLDSDGISEYVYGIIEYLDKEAGIYGDYRNHFYIFDQNMKLKDYIKFDDKRAALPYTFYWMKIKGQMRPAWVGKGQDIATEIDITDLWSVNGTAADTAANFRTKSDIHFYYLDENFKLKQMNAATENEKIVDIIQSSAEQMRAGILTVLIAKNLGTQTKPSYVNDFTIANVANAKMSSQVKVSNLAGAINYRNLVDTFTDKVMSLKSEASEFRGMMWYGLDAHQKQRVTLLDLEQRQITDKLLSSQRAVNDSALLIKAGFQSKERKGAFLLTNNDIEYHDLKSDRVVSTSLNRYSFFGDQNLVQLYFPLTIVDSTNATKKLPALYTVEGGGLSKAIRFLVPVYSENEQVTQMVSPARLKLKSEKGCKPLGAPVYLGDQLGFAADYQCETKIMRFLLRY